MTSDRPQHGDGAAGGRQAPLVDQLLHRAELAGEGELHVGTQGGVLGERHRVVGVRPVDQRRGHDHHVARRRPRRPARR